MGIFYPNHPAARACHPFSNLASGSFISLLGVAVAHGVALTLLMFIVPAERIAAFIQPLAVRLIELTPAIPPPHPAPLLPPKAHPLPKVRAIQPHLLAVATPTPAAPDAPAAFVVPPPPASSAPAETAVAPTPTFVASPAPVTAARFDAAYLQNPRPIYPALSRRLGEEGKVVVRVHVDAAGLATEVLVKTSSRFTRLDNAALEAIRQWRFVPARQGDVPTAAWVLVPIVFNLEG